ncbi:hypothetical protein FXW78_15360 [Rhodococcus opacus]|nr:hypothetical protein [Rhodococcus opacus]
MVSLADGAGIEWGIHTRFLQYLASLSDGACRIGDGVCTTAVGSFLFPGTAIEERCNGFVEFSGHSGLLQIWLARPGVEIRDGQPVLVMEMDRAGTRGAIADLTRTHEGSRTTTFVSVLREEAVDVFGRAYPAGEALAPLVLHHQRRLGQIRS